LFNQLDRNIALAIAGALIFAYLIGIYVGRCTVRFDFVFRNSKDLWVPIPPVGIKALSRGGVVAIDLLEGDLHGDVVATLLVKLTR